jgi:hypothetical protein
MRLVASFETESIWQRDCFSCNKLAAQLYIKFFIHNEELIVGLLITKPE